MAEWNPTVYIYLYLYILLFLGKLWVRICQKNHQAKLEGGYQLPQNSRYGNKNGATGKKDEDMLKSNLAVNGQHGEDRTGYPTQGLGQEKWWLTCCGKSESTYKRKV